VSDIEKPRGLPERYRLIEPLGSGAMGVVWKAEDRWLGWHVALKFLHPENDDPQWRARFEREARVLTQIQHPNVVAVHDFGDANGEPYLALDLVRGADARTWLDAEPRAPKDILAIWRQVARGLAAVHAAGILHRDLKPENVLVGTDGRAVITDFGLATRVAGEVPLTKEGHVVGTPLYMPVEILHGKPATAKTDQFAWCVCVWEALVGARPFPMKATLAQQAFALLAVPAPPEGSDRHLMNVLVRGLDPEPAKRWPDMAALVAKLERPWWARLFR